MFFTYNTQRLDTEFPKPNQKIDLTQLGEIIRSPPSFWGDMRVAAYNGIEDDDPNEREKATKLKANLPWIMPGGYCPIGHNKATLQYNGVVQLDYDFNTPGANITAAAIRDLVTGLCEAGLLPYLLVGTTSPRGYGDKFIVATDNTDPSQHEAAAAAVAAAFGEVLNKYNITIPVTPDKKCLRISQTCYIPYDPKAYIADPSKVVPFHFVPQKPKNDIKESTSKNGVHFDSTTPAHYKKAVAYLLENKVAVASCYDEYLPIVGACINAFGYDQGTAAAYEILSNSPEFIRSSFAAKYESKVKSIRIGTAPAGYLIKKAKEAGFQYYTPAPPTAATYYDAPAGEKFTDTLKRLGIQLTPADLCGKQWNVPTGSGKTFAVAQFAKHHKAVIVVPTKALARNVASEYNAFLYMGGNSSDPRAAQFIVTTYASFARLSTALPNKEYHLFIDEAHNLTASASREFMYKHCQQIISIAPQYGTTTLLTATPLYNTHPLIIAMPQHVIKQPQAGAKAYIYECAKPIAAAAHAMHQAVKLGKKAVVLFNNKGDELLRIQAQLSTNTEIQAVYFNADTKANADYTELCEAGELPAGCNVVVTTTVLKEGNNIYTGGNFVYIIIGSHHSSTIKQLSARTRNATTTEVHIFKGTQDEAKAKKASTFDLHRYAAQLQHFTAKDVERLNSEETPEDLRPETLRNDNIIRSYNGTPLPIALDPIHGYYVCDLLLSNQAHKQTTAAEYWHTPTQVAALQRYGFTVQVGTITKDYELPNAQEAIQAAKEVEQQTYNVELQKVANYTPDQVLQIALNTVKCGAKKAVTAVQNLVKEGLAVSEAVAVIQAVAPTPSEAKARHAVNCVRVHNYINDPATKRTTPGRYLRAIQKEFTNAPTLTKGEIYEAVAAINKAHGYRPPTDHKAAVKVVRLVFEVVPTTKRNAIKHVKVYRFVNQNLGTIIKKKNPKNGLHFDPSGAQPLPLSMVPF